MKTKTIRRGLFLLTMASSCVLAVGCELIVDFDRTQIPVDVSEASIPDSTTPETSVPVTEAGADATQDAPADSAAPDATDAGADG